MVSAPPAAIVGEAVTRNRLRPAKVPIVSGPLIVPENPMTGVGSVKVLPETAVRGSRSRSPNWKGMLLLKVFPAKTAPPALPKNVTVPSMVLL